MITIFKYNNRKLYLPKGQVAAAGYLTMPEIADLIRQGNDIQVLDKSRDKVGAPTGKNGQDITSDVLKQVFTTLDVQNDTIIELIKRHRGVNDAN
jgi:polyhydroxyalkanoate synthesis regulator protein